MAINGRINVDVLFHDTDGTTSLKVVSLEGATEYTSGKVAIVTGTVGTTQVGLWSIVDGIGFGGYKNASGNSLEMGVVSRVALRGSSGDGVQVEDIDGNSLKLLSRYDDLAIGSNSGSAIQIRNMSNGTASFTAVLYGT
jgi:hypothetical protein